MSQRRHYICTVIYLRCNNFRHLYIYIYVCVCICICTWSQFIQSITRVFSSMEYGPWRRFTLWHSRGQSGSSTPRKQCWGCKKMQSHLSQSSGRHVMSPLKCLVKNCGSSSTNYNLIDSTDVCSFGLGRRPDRSTRISYDHISKLQCKYSVSWFAQHETRYKTFPN